MLLGALAPGAWHLVAVAGTMGTAASPGRSRDRPAGVGAASPVDLPAPPPAIESVARRNDRFAADAVESAATSSRPAASVSGALLDASHAPILGAASAEVSLVDHAGRRFTADARVDGTFSLQTLAFGTYWVTASADGYHTLEEAIELCPERPSMRKDFTLQQANELRIRVTTPSGRSLLDALQEAGAPIGALRILPVATREHPGARMAEVVGNRNDRFGAGRFLDHGPKMEELGPGRIGVLLLDCDLPVWVSLLHHQVVLQSKRVGGSREEVNFVVSPDELIADLATIRLSVIAAATGLPIAGARVTLVGGAYFDVGVATDPLGLATIEGREPGVVDLHVCAAGFERSRSVVDARPGATVDLEPIALEPEVVIEGRVLDADDQPVAATFTLGILDPVDHRIGAAPQASFKSGGDGRFRVRGLGRREYVIRTCDRDGDGGSGWKDAPWVCGNQVVDLRAGSCNSLDLHLVRASRLVIRVDGEVAEALRFRVIDEEGLEVVTGVPHGSCPRPLDLPAGLYRVSLLDPQGAVLCERSVTLESEAVALDLFR